MRAARGLLILALLAAPATIAAAGDVTASAPRDVSVTIYRAPDRNGGDLELDDLEGFAVVTETRRIDLPAGESRVRFEGVADGIISESAIVRGLPGGVIEKNRDAALLSPSALLQAAVDGKVTLRRTDPVTGKARMIPATISSASEEGVVLKTAEGYEALRCSGMAETVRFERSANSLVAVPTLSVNTRTTQPTSAVVTLTYITDRFDWSASYTAQVSPDGTTMDLGGWITLANGNSVSLRDARAQIVAGSVFRAYVEKFVNAEPRVVAECYPLGKTSDIPLRPDAPYNLVRPYLEPPYLKWSDSIMVQGLLRRVPNLEMAAPVSVMSADSLAPPPPPEQLGDLKMYRVPQRTTIAANQMKQTRLLEQGAVKIERVLGFDFPARGYYWSGTYSSNARILVRTTNDKAHGLGLPLPAGSIVFEQLHGGQAMLVGQPALDDKAEGEEIELQVGSDTAIKAWQKAVQVAKGGVVPEGYSSELAAWLRTGRQVEEFELSNALSEPVEVELRLEGHEDVRITRASHAFTEVKGRRVAKVVIPANDRVIVRYTLE